MISEFFQHTFGFFDRMDDLISDLLVNTTPDDLRGGFKEMLKDQVKRACIDTTGTARRQAKIWMIFVIERFSEKLQDLKDTGKVSPDMFSRMIEVIDQAHTFAGKIVRESSPDYLEGFKSKQIVILPQDVERKEAQRDEVRSKFMNFIKGGPDAGIRGL